MEVDDEIYWEEHMAFDAQNDVSTRWQPDREDILIEEVDLGRE